MKKILALVLGAIAFGLIAGCSREQPAPLEIRVGLIVPITGDFAKTGGQMAVQSAKLAVQQVNEAGGLEVQGKKHQVVLAIADDKDSPDEAIAAARRLVYQENVVAIIGLLLSRIAIPTAQFLEQAQMPTISSTSTNPQTTAGKKYIFRVGFVDDFQGKVMANFAWQELKAEKAAVLYDIASPYNRGLAEVFKQVFEQSGGVVVAFESYTTDANTDFRPQLERIRDRNPDVLFLPNYDNDLPLQAQQIRQLGIGATLIGSDTWGAALPKVWSQLEGGFFTNLWHQDLDSSQTQAYLQAYRQTYNELPNNDAALTYDAFGLLFQAIRNQGKADPESIRQGLSQIKDYQGVSGTIEFQGTGDPIKSAVILEIKQGKPVFYQQVNP